MFDVIIATYNRIETALKLSDSILKAESKLINQIIIVDSSDFKYSKSLNNNKICYIKTEQKNQPYQRFLGYNVSKSEYLLFLDDDMELINDTIFEDCLSLFKTKNIIGLNLKFNHFNISLERIQKGDYNIFSNKSFFSIISGSPKLDKNKYTFCGIRGVRASNEYIEYLSGGCFAIKRDNAYNNVNMQLFDIYKKKLGRGEDGIFGYSIAKSGMLYASGTVYFNHNGQNESIYSLNTYIHAERFMYSRLFLSCEYYRLNNKAISKGYLRFHHYALAKIVGAIIRYLLKSNKTTEDLLKGYISGYYKACKFKFDSNLISKTFWLKQLNLDLNK